MIALILAAGRGSRLKKYTANKPKSLLTIYKNFTLLDYQINLLNKIGIKQIYIIVGYKKNLIINKYKKNKKIKFIFNKNWSCTNVLYSYSLGLKYLKDDFFFLHADSLTEINLYKKIIKSNKSALLIKKKACVDEDMKLYIINKRYLLTKNKLRNKPLGEFMGIAFFKKKLINNIKKNINKLKKNTNFNQFFFEEVINCLMKECKIDIIKTSNRKFVEVDFFKDLKRAKKEFKNIFKNFFYV